MLLAGGVSLSVAGFLFARDVHRREVEERFRAAAREEAEAINLGMRRGFETVLVLRDHFMGSAEPIDEDAFSAFTGPTVERHPYIQALQWLPLVTPENRAALEAAGRSRHPAFRFFDGLAERGGVSTPAVTESFHAVLFLAPLAGNEVALGYCARRVASRQEMIARATRTGGLAASGRIRLIQETGDQFGVLAAAAVPPSARRPPGLVQGVFRCGDLVTKSLAFLEPKGIDLRLEDESAPPTESLLHEARSPLPRLAGGPSGLSFSRRFELADRTWQVEATPTPGYYLLGAGPRAWTVLVAGLLFTLLIAKVLADMLARESEVSALVEARTRDLALEMESHRQDAAVLAQTEARLRQLVQVMAEGMWVVDPSGVTTFANSRMEEMLGVEAGGMVGRPAADWLFPGDRELLAEVFRVSAERPVQRELRLRRADGNGLWVILSASQIRGPQGELQGIIGILTDVTARRHDEEALRQSQKLESLGILAGGIAHDFNNLLSALMGHIGLARLELGEGSAAAGRLDEIESIARRAAELTRQMLAYSGKGRFRVGSLDLNGLVREMSHLLVVSLPKKVRLRCELREGLPPMLADAAQIQQVVMNLVTNAAESIEEQTGTVTLRTGLEQLTPEVLARDFAGQEDLEPGGFLTLEVTDTGRGMSPEIQARIFEPFFTTKFAGRGLGLSAMQGIVRGHRGGISIRSEPDRGTTFKLIFRASTEPAMPRSSPAPSDAAWTGGGVVLLVEDEEVVRNVSEDLLRSLGFAVDCAADGREAVERFRRDPGRYRAVLMDLTMPRLNGVEALQELRALDPSCRVILASGYDEAEAIRDLTAHQLVGFLQKPYRREDLRRVLREALGE